MSTRAKWTEGIPDLYDNLELAATYFTTEQVSDLTGFSANTITDLLSRKPITKGKNPLRPLSRPDRRVGSKPLYSRRQIDESLKLRNAVGSRYLGGQSQPLPKISAEEASKRDLISVPEIVDIVQMHEQTVRKWISRESGFPAAVATRDRESGHSGVPFVVRPRKAVIQWLIKEGKLTAEGKPMPAPMTGTVKSQASVTV